MYIKESPDRDQHPGFRAVSHEPAAPPTEHQGRPSGEHVERVFPASRHGAGLFALGPHPDPRRPRLHRGRGRAGRVARRRRRRDRGGGARPAAGAGGGADARRHHGPGPADPVAGPLRLRRTADHGRGGRDESGVRGKSRHSESGRHPRQYVSPQTQGRAAVRASGRGRSRGDRRGRREKRRGRRQTIWKSSVRISLFRFLSCLFNCPQNTWRRDIRRGMPRCR